MIPGAQCDDHWGVSAPATPTSDFRKSGSCYYLLVAGLSARCPDVTEAIDPAPTAADRKYFIAGISRRRDQKLADISRCQRTLVVGGANEQDGNAGVHGAPCLMERYRKFILRRRSNGGQAAAGSRACRSNEPRKTRPCLAPSVTLEGGVPGRRRAACRSLWIQ